MKDKTIWLFERVVESSTLSNLSNSPDLFVILVNNIIYLLEPLKDV